MQAIVDWYQATLGSHIPKEIFIFFVSMVPIVEMRGGIIIARLLDIPILQAAIICFAGNLVPIPFAILFLKKIFHWMRDHNIFTGLITKLENKAKSQSVRAQKGIFAFLLLFVGIPLPGTGGWTGSLIASLFDYDFKKSMIAIYCGILMALIIMLILSYGVLGFFLK